MNAGVTPLEIPVSTTHACRIEETRLPGTIHSTTTQEAEADEPRHSSSLPYHAYYCGDDQPPPTISTRCYPSTPVRTTRAPPTPSTLRSIFISLVKYSPLSIIPPGCMTRGGGHNPVTIEELEALQSHGRLWWRTVRRRSAI